MEQFLTSKNMHLKILSFLFLLTAFSAAQAQTSVPDSSKGNIVVEKDWRFEELGKKMAEYNENLAIRGGMKSAKGYRLMLMSTNDRQAAINVRTRLLQQYPDQKIYMVYQRPYIKLEFGNFVEKAEAEKYRKQITAMNIIRNNIYTIPRTIEIKVEKDEDE